MKSIKTLGIMLLISTQLSSAYAGKPLYQTMPANEEKFIYGGIGIVAGIFYPGDVNNLIEDHTSHLIVYGGISGMITNYGVKPSITFRINRIIEIETFGEFAWAPKYIIVDVGDSYYYSFTRMAPGITPKIHVPIGTGRHSIYFAPAVTYNFLKFKEFQDSNLEYRGHSIGGKMQVGFCLSFGKINLQPFIAYDYAKAVDRDSGYSEFELGFSSFQLGVEFHF